MTQAIVNNLNKTEEFMSFHNDFKNENLKVTSAMDRFNKELNSATHKVSNEDFKKVFDKKVVDNPINNGQIKTKKTSETSLTINDMKKSKDVSINDLSSQENQEALKEVLNEAISEANVQTSLDLTLAKDINEVISQLKVMLEDTEAEYEVETETKIETETDLTESLALEGNFVNIDVSAGDIQTEQENNSEEDSSQVLLAYVDRNVDFSKDSLTVKKIETDTESDLTQDFITEFVEIADVEAEIVKPVENEVPKSELSLEEDLLKDLNIESVEAQTDTGNDDFSMQNNTPEEHAIKAIINADVDSFDFKLDSAQNNLNTQNVTSKTVNVNPAKILDQIMKQMDSLQNNSKVNIVLNPESLGKVNIQLLTTKEGLTAQFTVMTQEARDILTKGLEGLKDSLLAQGINVENVSVKLTDTQKSNYNQDWTEQEGSRGGNKDQGRPDKEEKEKGMFEKMMAQTFEEEDGNV